jgi:hypothetical protein
VTEQIKSPRAALLNRLSEMQEAPYYATARDTLGQAERAIVQLEAEVSRAASAAAHAFKLADEAMFELIESEGVPIDDSRTVFGLIDECAMEVTELAKASPAMREAFEWLQPRGYVELGKDADGEFINVVRRPGEE